MEEGEILTNKLLLKIQDLTNEHQASFHIIFPFLPEQSVIKEVLLSFHQVK